jgi:hypothetical protein
MFCVVFIVERNLLSPNLECASRQSETALCLVQVDAIFYCSCVSKLRAVKKLTPPFSGARANFDAVAPGPCCGGGRPVKCSALAAAVGTSIPVLCGAYADGNTCQ